MYIVIYNKNRYIAAKTIEGWELTSIGTDVEISVDEATFNDQCEIAANVDFIRKTPVYFQSCDVAVEFLPPNVDRLPFPETFRANVERMAELYKDVKLYATRQDRVDAAMRFLETSADVFQAIKIAAGVTK